MYVIIRVILLKIKEYFFKFGRANDIDIMFRKILIVILLCAMIDPKETVCAMVFVCS